MYTHVHVYTYTMFSDNSFHLCATSCCGPCSHDTFGILTRADRDKKKQRHMFFIKTQHTHETHLLQAQCNLHITTHTDNAKGTHLRRAAASSKSAATQGRAAASALTRSCRSPIRKGPLTRRWGFWIVN